MAGLTRGSGNQTFGAYTNLGAFYVVGLPLATTLAFYYDLKARVLF